MTDEIKLLPSIPFACPTSLCDLDSLEEPVVVPPEAQTPYPCPACQRPNFVIISGVVICAACGSGTGMSVVSSNVVQELRAQRRQTNDGIVRMFEALLPVMENLGDAVPLAKPQVQHLANAIKIKLMELRL